MTNGDQAPGEQSLRVDRTVVSIVEDFPDEETRLWWHRQTPAARLRHVMALRKLNYGDRVDAGIQRVLEIIELP